MFHQEDKLTSITPENNYKPCDIDSGIVEGSVTLTTRHVLAGILRCAPDASITATLPSAADLVANDPEARKGFGRHIYICNGGTDVVIVETGVGGDRHGSGTVVASTYSGHFYLSYQNTSRGNEAYRLDRL